MKYRLDELSTAIRALSNACNNFNKTRDPAYLLDVMGRLRALVAMGGGDMKPLIVNIAEEQGIDMEMYSVPPKPQNAPANLAVHIYGSKTWAVNEIPGMQKYSLREWLNAPAYF